MLDLSVVRRAVPEVVAGHAGLAKGVRWVHSGEVSYIAEMLKGGELLLMTGIALGRGAEEQRRLVAELAERGAAALAIELGPRFSTLPRALAHEAERHGLPLIALHHEIRFVEITEAVHREIVGRQLELMRRGDELQRRLTSLMLAGAGVPEVLTELSHAIANPVVLERTRHGVAYHVAGRAGDAAVLAAWDTYVRKLPGMPEAVEQEVPAGEGERWGRLVALALDTPLEDHARVAVERVAALMALALLRDREDERVASRERGNFLAGLLEGEIDEAEARRRAADMGFPRGGRPMLPIAARPASAVAGGGVPTGERGWALAWREVERELRRRRVPAISGSRDLDRELLMAVGLHSEEARAGTADTVAALVRESCGRHVGATEAAVVCVGAAARGWTGLGAGLQAAVEGLDSAAHVSSRPWHDAARPDLDRLLWSLRDRPELRRFTEALLAPLLENDERHRSKLLPTLAAFCEHGGRKAETARALHIERQSLYHRLSRIEQLLDAKLSDGSVLLGLHLALRVRQQPPSAAPRSQGVRAGL